MYLAFPTPHDPRQAPQTYHAMYPVDKMELPPSWMSQHPFDNGHIVVRDEKLAPWPRTAQVARQHLSDYYAIITHLDAQIGRVIAALKESGLYERTLVVMAGDSGLAVGNHGLLGKQNIYDEDGVHVPFMLSGGWMRKEDRGRREAALCYIHDILPTICELTGVPTPKSAGGRSLVPVIYGKVDRIRNSTYHAYRQYQRAYRQGDFKLIEYVRAPDRDKVRGVFVAGSRVTQLFNVAEDPWETFNLADFPEYRERVATMRTAMREKSNALGDKADGQRTNVDFWEHF
jgi:arylsulfatase A-like enzyme